MATTWPLSAVPPAAAGRSVARRVMLPVAGTVLIAALLVAALRPDALSKPGIALNPAQPATGMAPQPPVAASIKTDVTLPAIEVFGVLANRGGRAAILAVAGGSQRRVALGGQAATGVTLADVTPTGIVVDTGATRYRLAVRAFGGASRPEAVVEPQPAPTAAAAHDNSGALSRAPFADAGRAADMSLQLRLGLKPVRDGEVTRGYRIAGRNLPVFAKAGLRAGDVVLAVNGSPFVRDEEVAELPEEIAQARSVIIAFERGGARQSVTLDMQE